MPPNGKLWSVAIGAAVVGALLGAGVVWARQQSSVAALNAQIIKADAKTESALQKAQELSTELEAAKAPPSAEVTGAVVPKSSVPAPTKKPAAKSVKQFTYITNVTGLGSSPVVVADYAQMLSGDAAAAAATAHGDESPPPNDYYIVNDNKLLRKLPVQPGVSVIVTTNDDGTSDPTGHSVTFANWAGNFAAPTAENESLRASPYWITIKNGKVVKIVQQYLP